MAAMVASIAFAGTALLTPLSIIAARRLGVLAQPAPGTEAVHTEPAPRLGGLAIVGGAALATALALCLIPVPPPMTHRLAAAIGIGSVLIAAVGLLDDLQQLSWRQKLAGEIGLASGVAAVGIRIGGLHPLVGVGLAVLWLVGVTNAVNFIDGMDGLAVGVSAIAALALVSIAARVGAAHVALLAAGLGGACIGFLLFNFYPSKTFMGDSGSLFLGFALAALLLALVDSPERYSVFCAAIIALGLPISDTLSSMCRRWRHRKSMFTGDLGHYYNQLIDRFGFSQRTTALASYGVAALLGVLATWVAGQPLSAALAATAIVGVLLSGVVVKLGFTDYAAIMTA